jgi:transposase-like protein
LVPAFCLLGRLDSVEVIGPALAAGVAGSSDASIAARIDVPAMTVRGWRRRHRARAGLVVAGVVAVIVAVTGIAPRLSGEVERASLEAVGALWAAARRVLGARAGPAWRCWAVVTGGAALAPNMIPPWNGLGGRGVLVPAPGTFSGGEEMKT